MKDSGLLVLALAIGVSIIAISNYRILNDQGKKEEPNLEHSEPKVLGNIEPPISSSNLQPKKASSILLETGDLINTSEQPVEQLESYTQSLGHSFLAKNNLWTGTAKIESLNF